MNLPDEGAGFMSTEMSDPGRCAAGGGAESNSRLADLGPLLLMTAIAATACTMQVLVYEPCRDSHYLLPSFVAAVAACYGSSAGAYAHFAVLALLVQSLPDADDLAGEVVVGLYDLMSIALASTIVLIMVEHHRTLATRLTAISAALERASGAQGSLQQEIEDDSGTDLAAQRTAALVTDAPLADEARAVPATLAGRFRSLEYVCREFAPAPVGQPASAIRQFLEAYSQESRDSHDEAPAIPPRLDAAGTSSPPSLPLSAGLTIDDSVIDALMHTFSQDRFGRVRAQLVWDEAAPGHFLLSVADDGIGLPAALVIRLGSGTLILEPPIPQSERQVTLAAREVLTSMRVQFPI